MTVAQPSSPEVAVAPSRRLARVAFAAMLAMYFCSFFQRSAIPGTIFNELQQEWNLTASAIVALGSVFLWTYGSMQLVAGVSIDRFGGTKTLLVGSVFMAIGSVLFPFSQTPGMLYASRALTAFGDSCVFLSIAKEASLLFDQKRFPIMIGILQFVGPCGGITAMLPFERATHIFGWRVALKAMAVLTCLVVFVNFLILPRLKHFVRPTGKFSLRPMWEILCRRQNWPMFVCGLINFPLYFVLQIGVGKKFLQDFTGLTSKQAATFTLIMMTASGVGSLASGLALQHTGGRRKPYLIAAVGMLLTALVLMIAGIHFKAGPWLFLLGYILLAVSNIANPIGATVIRELNEHDHVAQALALVNALAYSGVAILMMLSGAILDLFHNQVVKTDAGLIYPPEAYTTLFIILAGLAVISIISTCFIHETHVAFPHPSDLSETTETF